MKKTIVLISLFYLFTNIYAQKKPINIKALTSFQILKAKAISNYGNWITYQTAPFRGDSWLFIYDYKKNKTYKFTRGKNALISPDENYIAFRRTASYDSIFKLKLKNTPKKDFPKDSAYILITANANIIKLPRVKTILVPKENGSTLAILQYTDDSIQKKDKPQTYNLLILTPPDTSKLEIKNITKAQFSDNGKYLVFTTIEQDSINKKNEKIFILNTKNKRTKTLYSSTDQIANISISPTGHYIAFTSSSDTSEPQTFSLKLIDLRTKKLITVLDSNSKNIPQNWTVSQNKKILFSSDESKIYFGIAPKEPKYKDTIPEDEKPKVDIWSWTDSLLMPEQLVELEEAQKHSFLTVYFINSKRLLQIEKNKYEHTILSKSKNSNYVLIADPSHYLKQRSWDYPWWNDYYVFNLKTGKKLLAARKTDISYLSPSGKYVVWYNYRDSSWYVFNTKTTENKRLTNNSISIFWDREQDIPSPAGPYGFAGFDEKEKLVFIYDKYDIWAFSLDKPNTNFCLTNHYGQKNSIRFRIINFNDKNKVLKADKLLLKAFDYKTKDAGFFKITSLNTSLDPQKLIFTSHYYYTPLLAKNADILIWQRSRIDQYPDLQVSDINFSNIKQISHLISQQQNYIWATDTLVKWVTTDGKIEEGILVKPGNFDPKKKYPMLVYYYETNSDYLHRYYFLRPSRSIINPTHYASNGYIVFIPNIRYKTGYPGMSAYNYVISGTLSLIERYPWIDKKHIGLQGQSWGGYETAFIITQTNLFAAAMAGAPVSNMTSAYGGIRWGSGLSRMFQYEKTQSRIGGSLWDKLPLYIYNSPVFYAPKIHTPLLIMHNDNDGAVPWYQGIELFVALRRLNKPVWLLNYNGQPHNLEANSPDCVDLTIRMMQFFDHYLKNKPLPYWMKFGIPATQKGKNLGYQLVK